MSMKCIGSVAVALMVAAMAVPLAAQDSPATRHWALWLGGSYIGVNDMPYKVGEYITDEDDAMPELGFMLSGRKGHRSYNLHAHFHNPDQIDVAGLARIEDQLMIRVRYRSLEHVRPTDLMNNLLVREYDAVKDTTGGKMITHEFLDSLGSYDYTRHEISTAIEWHPRTAEWLELHAAHRSILEKGEDQLLVNMHCSSCHVQSMTVEHDQAQHNVTAGAVAERGKVRVGYDIGLQMFSSGAEEATVLYDSAGHPTTGTKGGDFKTRVSYHDEEVPVGVLPDIQKLTHALKGNFDLGRGKLLTRVSATTTENDNNGLKSTIYAGALKYTIPLRPGLALRAQARGSERETDEYNVDMLNWRAGAGGGGQDFDYTRYSTFTGRRGNGEVELSYRVNRRTQLAGLIGYEAEQREDYPSSGAKQTTNRYIGQVKARHRASAQVNVRAKYRLEITDRPFANFAGLFEQDGRHILEQNPATNLAYYYQREALRTGDITTEPTQGHYLDLGVNLRPSAKFSAHLAAKLSLEKNDDLDSLEYERTMYHPTVSATLTPAPEWSFFGSLSYQLDESNGPVTVALMDG